jgi:tetratricopeptide (TPR) repeat protein
VVGDDRLIMPYLILARAAAQQGAYGDAIETLNAGLSVEELNSNTELLMEQAQIYVQQRDYERALYAIFLALYIDPTIEKAYQLKIQIANARNRPGDAVLAAQDYLYYYPGSTTAFLLLGEARERENKDDMALEAYTQGLAGNSTDESVQQMLEARARIYQQQRQYDLALEDYSRLFQITDEPRVQILRMQTAFDAGDYEQALADANELTGRGTSQGLINLIRGGALVEQAQPGDTANLTQAVEALTQASASSDVAFGDMRGLVSEYLARAQLGLNDRDAALEAINAALTVGETGSRHYWRARILEAQNNPDEAITDYQWVVAWNKVFPFPFGADAQDRLDTLLGNNMPQSLPTVDAPGAEPDTQTDVD